MNKLKDQVIIKLLVELTNMQLNEVTMDEGFCDWCEGLREVIVNYEEG